ncbi:uncharacterized protein LOC131307631 [Rhododendron vialii]|uniref:uncharacterized protein LOC131307631 n=1 Tax=Rhododendron vialii TaxID=182163 RepID=UPI00265E0C2C|nr:uncharacterized protein LOC131307631 [Rhododendron vialii]
MDIWPCICELPITQEWDESPSQLVFPLATSKPSRHSSSSTQSIQLIANRVSGSDSDGSLTFSVCLSGFEAADAEEIIWVSDACPLSSSQPFLPLILQLIQEIVSRSPTAHGSTCPHSELLNIMPDPVSWILDSHSPESFSGFFNFIFLTHLFWLCVFDAPSAVGSFYFHSLLAPNIQVFASKHALVLRTFFISVGVDVELRFMRTLGYILAKWLILKEVGVGLQSLTPSSSHNLGFSYAKESHGLWVLKGYAPVWGMTSTRFDGEQSRPKIVEAKESVLRYALAHQQLEAVVQLEYTVRFTDGFILVNARVDNVRVHVAKLGFNENGDDYYAGEKHFPSRIRLWVGPETGSSYVSGLSLGRSTDNMEREMETQRILKGSFGKLKVPKVKAMARTTTRTRMKNWRWDQDAEGNAALFDAVLCDNTTGTEVATWKPSGGGGGRPENRFRKRYAGANRSFTKSGGLVFGGDECGGVGWRLGKEMEGSVLKWRVGCQIWLSYWPNEVSSSYFETRCVEWCDEVDLPLISGN